MLLLLLLLPTNFPHVVYLINYCCPMPEKELCGAHGETPPNRFCSRWWSKWAIKTIYTSGTDNKLEAYLLGIGVITSVYGVGVWWQVDEMKMTTWLYLCISKSSKLTIREVQESKPIFLKSNLRNWTVLKYKKNYPSILILWPSSSFLIAVTHRDVWERRQKVEHVCVVGGVVGSSTRHLSTRPVVVAQK